MLVRILLPKPGALAFCPGSFVSPLKEGVGHQIKAPSACFLSLGAPEVAGERVNRAGGGGGPGSHLSGRPRAAAAAGPGRGGGWGRTPRRLRLGE